MRRFVPGLAVPILVGLPLWVKTSWGVELLVAVSSALCVVAILRASLSMATAGGAVALVSLSLAFRQTPSSDGMLVPAVFGLALLLFIDGVHLCKRLDGAAVVRALWRQQIPWWTERGAISLGIAVVITVLAPAIALLLPAMWAPFLAGIGVLVAFVGAVAFAWTGVDE